METPLQQAKEVEISLLKIEETGFYMNTSPLAHFLEFDSNKLHIEFEFKIATEVSEDKFSIEILVRYNYSIHNEQIKVLEMSSNNHFKVFNLINLVEILPNDQITDKVGFLPTLISISISSLRGMLVIKTAGTMMSDFPIPLINPVNIIQNAVVSKPKSIEGADQF